MKELKTGLIVIAGILIGIGILSFFRQEKPVQEPQTFSGLFEGAGAIIGCCIGAILIIVIIIAIAAS
mgnify:CR=1 FL=1